MARDLDAMARVLRSRLPDGDRITAISTLSHGHSNETYLVEGLDQVMRLPPSETPLLGPNKVHDVVAQYDIYAELHALPNGPPTPAVGFVDRTGDILGDPFFLMERLPGKAWPDWEAPSWVVEASVATRESYSRQIVETYAGIHSMAPLKSLGRVLSLHDELKRWHEPVLELADANLAESFKILQDCAPEEAAPSVCQGDSKLANVLWSNDKLTAVLDWEMAFNGDPRWDLGYTLQFFTSPTHPGLPGFDSPGLWQRDRLIAEWEARTGRKADHLGWFEAAAKARGASIITYGDWLFRTGQCTDARFGTWVEAIAAAGKVSLDLSREAYRNRKAIV